MKISAIVFNLKKGPVSILKITKGQDSVNNIGGVKVSVLCILFVDVLYLYIVGHAQRW